MTDTKIASFADAKAAKQAEEFEETPPPEKGSRNVGSVTTKTCFDNMMFQTGEGTGPFQMLVDLRIPGVEVPAEFATSPFLPLNWSERYDYNVFETDEVGIRADLSFGEEQEVVYIPWAAVRQLDSEDPKVELVCANGWLVRTIVVQGEDTFLRLYSPLEGMRARAPGTEYLLPVSVRILTEWGLAETWAALYAMDLSLYTDGVSMIEPKADNMFKLSLGQLADLAAAKKGGE